MAKYNHRCAVLGKPIAHSLSPTLHNAAYRALALDDWWYDKHEVGETDLEGFLKTLNPQWAGLSLTMPLKKTIQPYGNPSDTWSGNCMWQTPWCSIGQARVAMEMKAFLSSGCTTRM